MNADLMRPAARRGAVEDGLSSAAGRATRAAGRARASRAERVLLSAALAATLAFFGGPFLWVLAAAFDAGDRSTMPWPSSPTLANFVDAFREFGFGRALANSLLVAGGTAVLATLGAGLAGHALARTRARGTGALAVAVLLLQTLPLAATMLPIYDLALRLDLHDSYLGLILVHAAVALPFLVWLMKGFFDAIPRDIEEAAWLDGASRLRAWWQVVLPVARPGIGVSAGLAFLAAWSEVTLVLVLVDDPGMRTAPLAFYRTARDTGGLGGVTFGQVAAMAVLYVLPVLALFLAARKLLVRGLVGGTQGL